MKDRDDFEILIDVCEKSINMVRSYWFKNTLKDLEKRIDGSQDETEKKHIKDIIFWTKDALIGMDSDIMSLQRTITDIKRK